MTVTSAQRPHNSLRPAAAALVALALLASAARAQESGFAARVDSRESRQSNALEVAVALGSAQGYGTIVPGGPNLGDLGVGVDLAVGWRINPRWMVGVYSAGGLYPSSSSSSTSSFGASAGVQANYHFATQGGPWIGLGTGWHGYWLAQDGGRTAYQGLDLVRLQLGFDVPVTPSFSLEPMLGVTLSRFLSQKAPSASAYADVKSSNISVFVLAGALARFDFFGHAGPRTDVLARN